MIVTKFLGYTLLVKHSPLVTKFGWVFKWVKSQSPNRCILINLFSLLSSMSIIKWLSLLLGIAQIWTAQPIPIRTQRNQSRKAGHLIKNEPHAFCLDQRVKFEQYPIVKTAIWLWTCSIAGSLFESYMQFKINLRLSTVMILLLW